MRHPSAFDSVFQRHHDVVFRYVASRVGPAVAEDVVGEVFLAAFASRAKFRPEISMSALPWLLGIATRRISRHRDAERRWVAQCQAAQGALVQDEDDGVDSRVDAERLAPRIDIALQALPVREREPLLLHVLVGLSYEEVAAALDIKLGTVRSRISRGRFALYELMGGLDSFERLSDVQIGDRTGIRLRFDPSDETLAADRERVLVLDADTGEVMRTETVDRRSWTTVEPARRVAEIGDERTLCREVDEVPCDLLDGTGPVAASGDRFVRDMQVRYAVHRENRRLKAELGDAAPPVMCLEMSDAGTCLPQTQEERRRIEAIAADVDALRAAATFDNASPGTGDDDAFHLGVPIAEPEHGVWQSSGQCSRTWRELTICRG